ncbi:MAG: polysaccharide biosynthesis tyrosine autokinase [Bryobacteraceae bacterium]
MPDDKSGSLPAPYDPARHAPPALPGATYTVLPESEDAQATVPLSHYLWILKRHRWRLLAFMAVGVGVTLLVSLRLTPIYEATATVDIDRQSPPGIVGQEANRAALNDADQFLATQVRLIQSDSVLRPVVRKYNLRDVEDAAEGRKLSDAAEDAPVKLKKLKITRPVNTYLLLISYRSTNPALAAAVANQVAHSYIETTYDLRFKESADLAEFMEKQIDELKAKMERSTSALAQFERELNVINPEEKTSILSARLLQLNSEYTSMEADRVRKEAAFDSLNTGSMEAAQTSTQGESLRKLAEHLDDAREKLAQAQAQFGPNHPEYRKAAAQVAEIERLLEQGRQNITARVTVEKMEAIDREAMLKRAVAETKAEFDALNARSFQYQQVKREAEADKKLYEELVTRIKEAGINANFQNSSIRLADPARPPLKPVFPNIPLNAGLAFLISALFGIGAAVLADVLDNTVRDPDEISRSLHTQVIGTLPSVKNWRKRLTPVSLSGEANAMAKLDSGAADSAASFAESIRTLRNSILLADFDRRLKSILITSAEPSEGKSTTAAYLALSNSQQGKKTLIIDSDLRRPSLHRRFGVPASVGLSSVLLGDVPWREAVVPASGVGNLDVLPAGPPSRRAADIVGAGVAGLLDEMSREYDMVILDAPPLLGFAESLQLSVVVDGVLIVARAGETTRKALGSATLTLARFRTNVIGIVLNEVKRDTADGYYYNYYGSRYYHSELDPAHQ